MVRIPGKWTLTPPPPVQREDIPPKKLRLRQSKHQLVITMRILFLTIFLSSVQDEVNGTRNKHFRSSTQQMKTKRFFSIYLQQCPSFSLNCGPWRPRQVPVNSVPYLQGICNVNKTLWLPLLCYLHETMAIEPSSYYKDWNQVFPEETGRSLFKHLREVSEPDNVFPVWSFTICTETMGAFYSTKSFENLEAAENGR